jgi:hypothetical protein
MTKISRDTNIHVTNLSYQWDMLKTDGEGIESLFTHTPLLPGLHRIASKLLPLEEAADVYRRASQSPTGFTTEKLLAEMNISVRVNSRDANRIPATGPVVVVANHPFGLLDGAALSVLLSRVRPDVRVMRILCSPASRNCGRPAFLSTHLGAKNRERRIWQQSGKH